MPRMFLSYAGIRVTDLERSLRFYTEILGLKEVRRGDNTKAGKGPYVLLRDPWSGQKLELNFYVPGSIYANPYVSGEALDHISFRVDNLDILLTELHRLGVKDAPGSPNHALPSGSRVAYVLDPDGNWVELYDHPGEQLTDPPQATEERDSPGANLEHSPASTGSGTGCSADRL